MDEPLNALPHLTALLAAFAALGSKFIDIMTVPGHGTMVVLRVDTDARVAELATALGLSRPVHRSLANSQSGGSWQWADACGHVAGVHITVIADHRRIDETEGQVAA